MELRPTCSLEISPQRHCMRQLRRHARVRIVDATQMRRKREENSMAATEDADYGCSTVTDAQGPAGGNCVSTQRGVRMSAWAQQVRIVRNRSSTRALSASALLLAFVCCAVSANTCR